MDLAEYYSISLAEEIIKFRDTIGLSVKWIQSVRVFYICVDNESEVRDESYAEMLGIDNIAYRGLLLKYGGTPGANKNINFDKREDAQKARDAIAFYVMIERRLRNESNRGIRPEQISRRYEEERSG